MSTRTEWLYRSGANEVPLQWDEIRELWEAVTHYTLNNIPTATTHSYRVVSSAGVEVAVNDSVANVAELATVVKQEVGNAYGRT